MTNLDSIFKSRDITLATKVHLVKAMVFPVVMYGCESWTVKKAERRRIDAFELWCWRRLLRFPWTARRSNQSILKEISPGISLEGMMLKLKLQYFGRPCKEWTHWKRLWCWEGLGAGGEWDDRGWDGWMASPTLWTWVWVSSRSWWWTGRLGVLQFMGLQRVGHDGATELNWTEGAYIYVSVQFSSVTQLCLTLCNPMDCSTSGFPVHHQLEFQSTETPVSASASVLPMNIQDWFPLELTGFISLQSKGLSRVFSKTTVQKHQFFGACSAFFIVQLWHPYRKNHSFD